MTMCATKEMSGFWTSGAEFHPTIDSDRYNFTHPARTLPPLLTKVSLAIAPNDRLKVVIGEAGQRNKDKKAR